MRLSEPHPPPTTLPRTLRAATAPYADCRAAIILSNKDKHTLPVNDSCGYSHAKGIGSLVGSVCTPPRGADQTLENYVDLYRCAQQSACRIVDDRLQMSVMRDPR